MPKKTARRSKPNDVENVKEFRKAKLNVIDVVKLASGKRADQNRITNALVPPRRHPTDCLQRPKSKFLSLERNKRTQTISH